MGRKPKIIPHIPRTLEQMADAMFAKDRAYIQAKKRKRKNPSAQARNAQDPN